MQQQIWNSCRTLFYNLGKIAWIRKFLSRFAAAQLVSSGRSLRSSSALYVHLNLVPPSARVKTHGLRAFANHAPVVWNKLSVSVCSMSNLSNFRTALKTHLFRDAFNVRP